MREAIVIGLFFSSAAASVFGQSAGPLAEGLPTQSGDVVDINAFVGATRFHDAGYTGTRSTLAALEPGDVWTGHEALSHVTLYRLFESAAGQHTHITGVAHAMGGRDPFDEPGDAGNFREGVAHGATIWSANFQFGQPYDVNSSNFNLPDVGQFQEGLYDLLVDGIDGRTADVINNSWGAEVNSADAPYALMFDGVAEASGALIVHAAGNSGEDGPESVGTPASSFNGLSVGATGLLNSFEDRYESVAEYSSYGYVSFRLPDGTEIERAAVGVDIVAPGLMSLAVGDFGAASDAYAVAVGTSFAAPTVTGGAGLVIDAARGELPDVDTADDARVVKAVLMNSANKLEGWDNGQNRMSDAWITTDALDIRQGTGQMDLDAAFDQLLSGQTDLNGQSGGTVTHQVGWDFGSVAEGGSNEYISSLVFEAGTELTATLAWHVNMDSLIDFDNETFGVNGYDSFANLELEIFEYANGVVGDLLAASLTDFNNLEHLSFTLEENTQLAFRISSVGDVFDLGANDIWTDYAFAWAGTAVPTPAGVAMVPLAGVLSCRRRRVG